MKVLRSEQVICLDETHCHNSPIQNMVTLEIGRHAVEITQDGDRFNIRIDGGRAEFGLSFTELNQFVKDNT